MPPIFSIIVPVTRNAGVKRLLSFLSKQSFDLGKTETILVYSSNDITAPEDFSFNILPLFSQENHPGIKRNIGCKAASGEYYVFLDDDCFPGPDWLEQGFRLLQKHKVVCGPCGLKEGAFSERLSRAISGCFFGSGNRICCNYKDEEVPFYNVGFYNVFMHRKVWEIAGGCNESANFLMDDKELFFLLSLRGIKFHNSENIAVSHGARSFPWEFLKTCFARKVSTGINVFVYNEIFRRQKIFFFIYFFYIFIPFLMIFSWKLFCILMIAYYLLLMFMYRGFLKKDPGIYFCLPPAVILTNIVMAAGVLCGSVYFWLNRSGFKEEIILKKERIVRVLSYA